MTASLLILDNIGVALTLCGAIVIILVVCMTMNHRPLIERMLGHCVSVSLFGAFLDRFASLMAAYDPDGSVRLVSMFVIDVSRLGMVTMGATLIIRHLMHKRMMKQTMRYCSPVVHDMKSPYALSR